MDKTIDNNLVENAIRPVAVGRKNYLFAVCQEHCESGDALSKMRESTSRSRLTGAGFKPPYAALIKSRGSERCGKGSTKLLGVCVRDDGKKPPTKYRKVKDYVETGALRMLRDESKSNLFTAWMAYGTQVA